MSHLPELGAHASLSFFRNKFPYSSNRNYTAEEYKILHKKYDKWSVITICIAMLVLLGMPLPYAIACHYFYNMVYTAMLQANETFYATGWINFVLTTFFAGIATIVWWIELLQRIVLYPKYDEFEDFYNDQQGYDNHKAGIFFGKIGAYCMLVTLPFTFGARIICKSDAVVVKSNFYLVAKEFKYTEVKQISEINAFEAKDGSVSKNPHHKIVFNDGTVLNCSFYFDDFNSSAAFAQDLSRRSGLPIFHEAIEYFKDREILFK